MTELQHRPGAAPRVQRLESLFSVSVDWGALSALYTKTADEDDRTRLRAALTAGGETVILLTPPRHPF